MGKAVTVNKSARNINISNELNTQLEETLLLRNIIFDIFIQLIPVVCRTMSAQGMMDYSLFWPRNSENYFCRK